MFHLVSWDAHRDFVAEIFKRFITILLLDHSQYQDIYEHKYFKVTVRRSSTPIKAASPFNRHAGKPYSHKKQKIFIEPPSSSMKRKFFVLNK